MSEFNLDAARLSPVQFTDYLLQGTEQTPALEPVSHQAQPLTKLVELGRIYARLEPVAAIN